MGFRECGILSDDNVGIPPKWVSIRDSLRHFSPSEVLGRDDFRLELAASE